MLLNEETERYVFRVLALKTIFENPEKYGIFVSEELGYKPFRYKTVTVTKNIDSWADFAEEHGITYKLLKVFNPWLRSKSLKVGKGEVYEIKIPKAPFDITHKDYEDMLGKHNIAIYKDSINDTIIY